MPAHEPKAVEAEAEEQKNAVETAEVHAEAISEQLFFWCLHCIEPVGYNQMFNVHQVVAVVDNDLELRLNQDLELDTWTAWTFIDL